MGARHTLDLTSDVTHLIVGDIDTPKYQYVAKERPDIKVVLPKWVEAVRQSWMAGGETQVEELELRHRVPTFHGMRICITGFEDGNLQSAETVALGLTDDAAMARQEIEDLVNNNGGEYFGDLNRDMRLLIAKNMTGSKFHFAQSWDIKTVGIEWLHQSLERGMVLDENLYSLHLDPSERGQGAWNRKLGSKNPRKRPREDLNRTGSGRKLRRTASAKFDSQNDGMWTDIVNAENRQSELRRSEWEDPDSSVVEIHLVPDTKAPNPPQAARTGPAALTSILRPKAKQGMFWGRSFYLHGFGDKEVCTSLHPHSHPLTREDVNPGEAFTIPKCDHRVGYDSALSINRSRQLKRDVCGYSPSIEG